MIVAFPLTPALSLREREKHSPPQAGCPSIGVKRGAPVSLSLGERAGVRGKSALHVRRQPGVSSPS